MINAQGFKHSYSIMQDRKHSRAEKGSALTLRIIYVRGDLHEVSLSCMTLTKHQCKVIKTGLSYLKLYRVIE